MKKVLFSMLLLLSSWLSFAQDEPSLSASFFHQVSDNYRLLYESSELPITTQERDEICHGLFSGMVLMLKGMPAEERAKIDWQRPGLPVLFELFNTDMPTLHYTVSYSDELENVFFTIDSVASTAEGSAKVYIKHGRLDGITDSSAGWAWTGYQNEDQAPDRKSNNYLGSASVTLLENAKAELTVTLSEENGFTVLPEDVIELRIPKREVEPSLLGELMDYSIHFKSIWGEPLTERNLFIYLGEATIQDRVFQALLEDVHTTADLFADDPQFTSTMVAGGRFDGMNLIEAMQAATSVDMRMFLGFVRDFPGKYMAHTWRISETFATWLINATPIEEEASYWLMDSLVSFHQSSRFEPFVKTYAFYLNDSLENDMLDRMYEASAEGKYDVMRQQAEVLYDMGVILEDTSAMLSAMDNIGFSYQMDSSYFKAIEWHTKALRLDGAYLNALWNRSNAYGGLGQYADAIADLEVLFEYAPWFSTAPGNIGWYYMKQGEIEKSAPYIQQAFEMDSSTMAWNVNYGHLKLLTGKKEEAYQFYQRTLDLLQSEDEYIHGPVGDFDIFLEKGWFRSEVQAAKDWMQDQYDRIYKHRVLSNAAWDSAGVYKDQELWDEALVWYEKALAHEMDGEQPRDWEIYLYEGWIGRCYQEMENYEKGVASYRNTLAAAQKISTDEVINSYELLGWIHREMGKPTRSSAYYAEAKALERLKTEKEGSKDLYVIAIGIDSYPDMQYLHAEQDATAVADQFTGNASLLFDRVHTELLAGAKATRQAIQQAFTYVIEHAKPGDTFVCYWAGGVEEKSGYFMAADYGSDTTKVIPALLLNNWLNLAPATKQLVVVDASQPDFAGELLRLFSNNDDSDQSHYRAVLSPFGARRERDNMEHSLLTHYLIKGLGGEANPMVGADSMISVKELEAYVSGQLSKPQQYERLLSFVQGVDFGLTYTAPLVAMAIDTIPPEIEVRTPRLTRGGLTETQEASATIEAKIFDGSGLKSVRLNNQTVTMSEGNILETFVSLAIGTNEYVIEAVDEYGNSATDTLIIKRVPQNRNTVTSTDRISFGKPKSRNIALFIASDTYQEWNNLNNPVRDARAIQRELALQYGFEVDTLYNPTKEQFEDKIYSYLEGNFNEEDRLFVFIAGHGVYDNIMQDGYLATYDSKKNAKRKEESYVPLSWLSMKLDRCQFNKIFVMIDACFGGAFGDLQYANSGDKTRLYLTSGNKVYVDDGPKGGHSPFAYGILEVLRNQGRKQGQITAMSFPVYLQQVESLQTEPRFGAFASSSRDPEFTFEFNQKVSGIRSADIGTGF